MPISSKMFVEQSHLAMPSTVWLHINGVSLTTDIPPYQPPVHSYDYRTKHLQSPVQPPTPPLISSPVVIPYSITMIDGPYSNNNMNNMNKLSQKWENTDMPKKLFIDRQIKKAKSLPGLIKGTALSRHTPLQSSTFTSPPPLNLSTNIQDDQLPIVTGDNNDDDSIPLPSTNEPRRPRVYFADFNRVQFIEDNHDLSQYHPIPINPPHRRHRRRLTKKTSNINGTNHISPSIQQPQILETISRPLSRQPHPQIAQELSIKKQQLLISPRIHSSRTGHLPDILNQSIPNEPSLNEYSNGKYVLQREKPFLRLPKPATDIPVNSSLDISTDSVRHDTDNTTLIKDSHNQTLDSEINDSSNGILIQASSLFSSTSPNRQRPSLRTISLRQQFISPIKLKSTNNNQPQQLNNSALNTRRSASLKHTTLRMHNDNDDIHPIKPIITNENRPMTGTVSMKKLKRSDVIHFNSKTPLLSNPINDSNKSHVYDHQQGRFQNLLTIVRPPYASNIPNDSTINPNLPIGNIRSSRSTSARDYPLTPNTIFV